MSQSGRSLVISPYGGDVISALLAAMTERVAGGWRGYWCAYLSALSCCRAGCRPFALLRTFGRRDILPQRGRLRGFSSMQGAEAAWTKGVDRLGRCSYNIHPEPINFEPQTMNPQE
jgi:hypothetical protein